MTTWPSAFTAFTTKRESALGMDVVRVWVLLVLVSSSKFYVLTQFASFQPGKKSFQAPSSWLAGQNHSEEKSPSVRRRLLSHAPPRTRGCCAPRRQPDAAGSAGTPAVRRGAEPGPGAPPLSRGLREPRFQLGIPNGGFPRVTSP